MKKTNSDEQKHQSKQNPSDSISKKFFSEVLDEACEREQQKNIHIYTTGYTRTALPYHNYIKMREYR